MKRIAAALLLLSLATPIFAAPVGPRNPKDRPVVKIVRLIVQTLDDLVGPKP